MVSALIPLAPLVVLGAQNGSAAAGPAVSFDQGLIHYSDLRADNPVARLRQRLKGGDALLNYDQTYGYLLGLLEELRIPVESQTLVFSKSSLQVNNISPANPRSIYFNDGVYVAWIPSAPLLEIAAADARLGAVFYTLQQKKVTRPRVRREDRCLECHVSSRTLGVPGFLVRSFATDAQGDPDRLSGALLVNQSTPLSERWGGWYVCGKHGDQTHRGNLIGKAAFERQASEPNYRGNLLELSQFFDVKRYPRPTSDIVALMVLEHQTYMQNFIARLNYEANQEMTRHGYLGEMDDLIEAFLKYLLFADEAPLTSPIEGTSGFTESFQNRGPRDHLGRSLRQFDLRTRLFKYPCSYLIYSEAFDGLQINVKKNVLYRLFRILSGKAHTPLARSISPETKQAILAILIDTKPNLPGYWTLQEDQED